MSAVQEMAAELRSIESDIDAESTRLVQKLRETAAGPGLDEVPGRLGAVSARLMEEPLAEVVVELALIAREITERVGCSTDLPAELVESAYRVRLLAGRVEAIWSDWHSIIEEVSA